MLVPPALQPIKPVPPPAAPAVEKHAAATGTVTADSLHHLLLHHDNASEFRPTTTVAAFRTDDPIVFTKPWGTSVAKSGDYVVVGGDGDLFAMDSDAFGRTYERVEGTGDDRGRIGGRVGQAGYGLGATIGGGSAAMHARYRPRGVGGFPGRAGTVRTISGPAPCSLTTAVHGIPLGATRPVKIIKAALNA